MTKEKKDIIISLQELLKGRNIDFDNTSDKEIQLIRHADHRVKKSSKDNKSTDLRINGNPVPPGVSSLYELYIYHRDLFEKYQSEQKKDKFDKIKYWVVFLGETGTTCRLLGVYEITGRKESEHKTDEEILSLRPVPEFKLLEEKVIIDWGPSVKNWHQFYYNEKEVIRIDEGLIKADGTPVFKSYQDVILTYRQLLLVLKDPNWIKMLKALNCIYLIKDKSNGKEYIGSTSGREGIFQRWSDYAKDGHAGDVELEKLIKADPLYHHKNFQWTILETLNSNITQQEAIERENLWKRKLITLSKHGYNKN